MTVPPKSSGTGSTWGCPHEDHGRCRLLRSDCDPGLPGCVLRGKGFFPNHPERTPTPEEAERLERRTAKRRRRA